MLIAKCLTYPDKGWNSQWWWFWIWLANSLRYFQSRFYILLLKGNWFMMPHLLKIYPIKIEATIILVGLADWYSDLKGSYHNWLCRKIFSRRKNANSKVRFLKHIYAPISNEYQPTLGNSDKLVEMDTACMLSFFDWYVNIKIDCWARQSLHQSWRIYDAFLVDTALVLTSTTST